MSGHASPRAVGRTALIRLVAALLVGFGLGWWLRDFADPIREPDRTASSRPTSDDGSGRTDRVAERDDPEADAASIRMWSSLALALATQSAELEDLVAELEAESGDARAALDRAIDQASDPELATVLSAVTRIDENDLLAQGDLRPFASRLVEVALDGLQGPTQEPPAEHRVYFASTTRDFDPDSGAQDRFPIDQGRIYATIDLGDYAGDRVMVKWLNAESHRIHSLQSMGYQPGQRLWSYLSKDGEWEPGLYQVSIYSQDATMQLLGRGEYTVF